MRRQDFIDNINDWSDLIEFCSDFGCWYCDDVFDEYIRDDYLDSTLVDMANNADGWRDLCNQLNDIPTYNGYFIRDDYGEWFEATQEYFDRYKDDVLSWADDDDIWDDDDDENENNDETYNHEGLVVEEVEDDDEELTVEEECTFNDLFAVCYQSMVDIRMTQDTEKTEDEKMFQTLVDCFG